jgi:hypothetical protein
MTNEEYLNLEEGDLVLSYDIFGIETYFYVNGVYDVMGERWINIVDLESSTFPITETMTHTGVIDIEVAYKINSNNIQSNIDLTSDKEPPCCGNYNKHNADCAYKKWNDNRSKKWRIK